MTVNNATLVNDGRQNMASLFLVNHAVATHDGATPTATHLLDLHVSGTVTIDSTSRIDVSGKGYLAGSTTGNTTAGAASGGLVSGSYGGVAGDVGGGPTNATYGDYADPDDWGSGGGGGGAGGGLVHLVAATLTLDGQLLAQGGSGYSSGGSGGGIYVSVTTLQGQGSIQAGGGTSQGTQGTLLPTPGGGGGRVAVYAQDRSGFDASRITAPAAAPARFTFAIPMSHAAR